MEALPASPALRAAFDAAALRDLQATGGDDYELCFTAPASARADLERSDGAPATRIGCIVEGQGVHARDAAGERWGSRRAGYQHFA